jgi:hypothetical protein
MPVYERLIDNGIADAGQRGGAIDHITAGGWPSGRPPRGRGAYLLATKHSTV